MTHFRLALTLSLPILLAACGAAFTVPDQPTAAPHGTLRTLSDGTCPSCGRVSFIPVTRFRFALQSTPVISVLIQGDTASEAGGVAVGSVLDIQADLVHLQFVDPAEGLPREDLPLACLLPLNLPRPAGLADPAWGLDGQLRDAWSGGTIRFTPALNLSSTEAADQHCRASYGNDWRALTAADSVDLPVSGFTARDVWGVGSNRVSSPPAR